MFRCSQFVFKKISWNNLIGTTSSELEPSHSLDESIFQFWLITALTAQINQTETEKKVSVVLRKCTNGKIGTGNDANEMNEKKKKVK